MLRVALHPGKWHLVGAPRVADLLAIHVHRPGPALGATQDDHGPARTARHAVLSGICLDGLDLVQSLVKRSGETMVHARQVVAGHLDHLVPVALEQAADLGGIFSGKHGRAGDLVAVEVKDRQDRTVPGGIKEGDALPRSLQRPGFGFAVAHDCQREQIWVVHGRPESMDEHVAEFATLVDRTRSSDADVAGNTTGRREATEESAHSRGVLRSVGVGVGPGALEPRRRGERWTAVPRTGEEHRGLTAFADRTGHVRVDKSQTRRGSPVPEQARLDVVVRQLAAD